VCTSTAPSDTARCRCSIRSCCTQREPFPGNGMLVLFKKGDQIVVSTEGEPVRFLLMSGRPIAEPAAWYGPIVMNTEEELRVAFEEYRRGTFIRHRDSRAPATT
jgi:redox-sensitive bicupin YhaK (pirin superfamily)